MSDRVKQGLIKQLEVRGNRVEYDALMKSVSWREGVRFYTRPGAPDA